MGILFRTPILFIGFPSSYISEYFTCAKFEYSLVASIIVLGLCLKHVTWIGVLIGSA